MSTALTHDTIRVAALAQIDRHGLDGFSTRKLGVALGCEAMALYYYYPSKEALLDAVVDELMAQVAEEARLGEGTWLAALRRVAHAYRSIARRHPHAFPLLATRRFASERTYAFLDALFERARVQGVADRTVARVYRAVSSYCNGFALNELAARREPHTAALRARYPRVAAVSGWLEPQHLDDVFEAGLDLLLAPLTSGSRGLAARGKRRRVRLDVARRS